MPIRRKLASVHFFSTAWFILCVGYIGILALRQAGVKWWILFSLSGHGILIALVLMSLYLFAIFRGISSNQKLKVEHPLTCTTQYGFFYVATPFLGAIAGFLGMIGVDTVGQLLLGISLGTLATTFFVWIIVDPLVGLFETFLPASHRHKIQRIARTKAEREQKQRNNRLILAEISANESSDRNRWRELMRPHAEKLASLLVVEGNDYEHAEYEAAEIGAEAWQAGGLSCMRELREMALAICRDRYNKSDIVDYIAFWWDGIGSWRSPFIGRMKG
ncbi:MAG: hypothetical protein JW715_00970 [Sedimentisphaerales bacterium]|nr:hypothetical protein [Sedimentisphaerales bacterium]